MSHDLEAANTICPVCGRPVASDMPPITADPGYPGHQAPDVTQHGFRVCTPECAHLTARDPERYRIAAQANAVAAPPEARA